MFFLFTLLYFTTVFYCTDAVSGVGGNPLMPYNNIGFSKPGGSNGESLFKKEKVGIFRILLQCTI
jgi:hypothetical protein